MILAVATKPRAIPAPNDARHRKRTPEETKRLQADPLLRRIHARRERIRKRFGMMKPPSWVLIREDRDR